MTDLPERVAQAVAERVVTLVIDALDFDDLLARIDLDTLIARIDVDAIVGRLDMEALVARIDLASTAAATATGAADEAVGALRRNAARGDEVASRWAGRLVGRR